MNGSKAKALRKQIYGDASQRARTYQGAGAMGPLELLKAHARQRKRPMGTVRCAGKRAEYQARKRSIGRSHD